MSFDVTNTQRFAKELKRLVKKYPSLKSEYVELVSSLEENSTQGSLIGSGFYKIRISIGSKGKGKRGGARVITLVNVSGESVILVTIYDKSEKDDVDISELNSIL